MALRHQQQWGAKSGCFPRYGRSRVTLCDGDALVRWARRF